MVTAAAEVGEAAMATRVAESEKEYLSRSEVASIFEVSPNTVTRWADAGKLPYVRTLGGHRRYHRLAVHNLAERLRLEEEGGVEELILRSPRLYGDHHVIAVRNLLLEQPGIGEVVASSAFQEIRLLYDPEAIQPAEIQAVLWRSGYPPPPTDVPSSGKPGKGR